jgi:hypothetical protein
MIQKSARFSKDSSTPMMQNPIAVIIIVSALKELKFVIEFEGGGQAI